MIWIANVSVQLPGYKVDDSRIGVKIPGACGHSFFSMLSRFYFKMLFFPFNP